MPRPHSADPWHDQVIAQNVIPTSVGLGPVGHSGQGQARVHAVVGRHGRSVPKPGGVDSRLKRSQRPD
eukprot:939119-Alexandrium_andersonii.AAC.1